MLPWTPVCDVPAALKCFASCADQEALVCALDSALHQKMLPLVLAREILDLSAHGAPVPELDLRSESGLETLARIRLGRLGIESIPQVKVLDIARLDLLVGDRLDIELDGRTWHEQQEQRVKDALRDASLASLGFQVLRFPFSQVIYDWEIVESAILGAIADGHHLSARRN